MFWSVKKQRWFLGPDLPEVLIINENSIQCTCGVAVNSSTAYIFSKPFGKAIHILKSVAKSRLHTNFYNQYKYNHWLRLGLVADSKIKTITWMEFEDGL